MEVTCISPDLKKLSSSYIKKLIEQESSDIIIFPEYLLELVDLPLIKTDKSIFWGSKEKDSSNTFTYQINNKIYEYQKIKLTPWERHLKAGEKIATFNIKGFKVALLVCYDVEFPELSQRLKAENIDLLIVPAATESEQGYLRVSRCASARAIELGCAVVTCHLIGKTDLEVVDVNVGNNNIFYPAQSLFKDFPSEIRKAINDSEVVQRFQIDLDLIREQRLLKDETNPCL